MLCKLYWPGVSRGVLWYPIIVFMLTFVSAAIAHGFGSWPMVMYSVPISVMFVCSPIIFTRRDYQSVSAQLPVTASEKLGFLLMVCWILMPALIFLSATVGEWVASAIFGQDIKSAIEAVAKGISNWRTVSGFIQIYCILTIALYYNVTRRKNRAGATLVSAFVAYISFMVIAGIVMFSIGLYMGFQAAANAPEPDFDALFTSTLIDNMIRYWDVAAISLFAIVALVYLKKLYTHLRNHGF